MKVTLLMALTADGKIARSDAHLTDWTESEDKKIFKIFTQKAGVVIMGSKTYDTLDRPLPGRKVVILTRKKGRVSPWDNIVFSNLHPGQLLAELEREGYRHVVVSGGAMINTLFAKNRLIDDMILTYSPRIFGTGVSLFSEALDMDLILKEVHRAGENLIYAHYAVVRPKDSRHVKTI
jgi:dihydrofolate reductase